MLVKNLFYYSYTFLKKHCSLVFSYTFSQVKKIEFHTLTIKKNCCNCLYINSLGVFFIMMFIFITGTIYYTQVTWFKMDIIEICCCVNIYLYIMHIVLLFIFIPLYAFVLKKILLIKGISNILPNEFMSIISNKIKIKDRFIYMFSLKFLKIFLLTSFFVLLPQISYYIYFNSFFYPSKSIELFINILYICICYNFSNCCVNRVRFFSYNNMCSIAYSFILLLLAKITVIYLIMPLLLPYIIFNNEHIGINKHIDYFEKNTLKILKRFPIMHKLVFIKINNNVFFNTCIAKLRYNNISTPLNNSSAKYIPKIKFSALTTYNSKPRSVIISAIQSSKQTSSCLMFTYNDRSSFISIDRLSVFNIPSLNTQTLRVDTLGFLPKSGYFNKSNINLVIKPKALEISAFSSNNVLLKNTTCSKPFSKNSIIEKKVSEFIVENKQEIPLSSDIPDLLANLKKYSLNRKIDNFINNNISPDLLNPFVFMVNLPDQYPEDNGFNKGNNKGKRKATDEEIRAWEDQDTVNNEQLVQMEIDTDTSKLDIFQDEAIRNLMTPEELAMQSSFINFYNTVEIIDIDYELLKIDLSIYQEDLTDISSCIDYFGSNIASVDLDYLNVKPVALYRLITEYPSFFDEDSANRHNVIEGLSDLNDYLTYERKAAISGFMKEKATNIDQNTVIKEKASAKSHNTISISDSVVTNKDKDTLKPAWKPVSRKSKAGYVWERLHYSSDQQYQDAVKQRYDEICMGYYKDNRGDAISVYGLMNRARKQVIDSRVKELGSGHNSISDIKHRNVITTKITWEKDRSYYKDKAKINNDKRLSAEEKQIQLQARIKLHKDILNEYRTKNKQEVQPLP